MSDEKKSESAVEERIPLVVSHSEILEENRKRRWPENSAEKAKEPAEKE